MDRPYIDVADPIDTTDQPKLKTGFDFKRLSSHARTDWQGDLRYLLEPVITVFDEQH